MTIELQNKVWSILPKEFKEEVKRMHRIADSDVDQMIVMITLENVFGHHNLTSDAEGEEMLTVPRKKVEEKWQRAYEQEAQYSRAQDSPVARLELYYNRGILSILDILFGSKCLPDAHEDNFASKKPQPAEPKEEANKQFNNILKDSFRNKRRLNIAAQIVASMIGSDNWTTWRGGSNKEIWHNMAKSSLEIANALIDECEKGGEE